MDWFKVQHGIMADSNVAVIARRTGQTRAVVLGVWLSLMEYASRNTPRGSVTGVDAEAFSALLDIDTAAVQDIMDHLRERGVIDADGIRGWQSLQHLSTDRVRAYRLRRKHNRKTPKSSA